MIEELKLKYGTNFPIFSSEILSDFSNFTKAYVFRLIKKAEEKKQLKKFCQGVYYIPTQTFIGESTITPNDVIIKKYIKNKDKIYGIYGGLKLLNMFAITEQVPQVIEIISNNEKSRNRKININGRTFILKKSRCKITNKNYTAYMVLELFLDMDKRDILDDLSLKLMTNFLNENKVSLQQLIEVGHYFPSITLKRLLESEVIYGLKKF